MALPFSELKTVTPSCNEMCLVLSVLPPSTTIISLILVSFLVFYIRNIQRINEELTIVKDNKFPLFYSPKQNYKEFVLEHKTKLYVPTDLSGCWAIKTLQS